MKNLFSKSIAKNFLCKLVISTSLLVSLVGHTAQTYPSQTIKFIVPYSPGGLPDTVARQLSVLLGESLGQTIIVENKPGAGGIVAGQVVKAAPADGYTLLITDTISYNTSHLVSSNLSFDPRKDFKAIAIVAKAPNFLAISPSLPVNNLSELSKYIKDHPGEINYGSSGIGTPHHLAMEALKLALNWNINHIPYKGTAQSVPALVGGQVQALFAAYPSLIGFEKNGKVKIIGASTIKPSKIAPEVPALGANIPGYEYVHTIAIFGLESLPKHVTTKLNQALNTVASQPKAIENFKSMGIELEITGPIESAKWVKEENERINALIKEAKIY